MAVIRIKNLLLRTIVGIKKEEREKKQDVMINIELEMDHSQAAASDQIENTLDYRALTKRIIGLVEKSQFFLVETLADEILKLVMEDPRVEKGRVEVDKPHALRFAQSVSIEVQASRS